ncbi:MAG: inorganic phosphate transporter [Calditrichaeota bacterium]|nr:inorganic phosphate transporter [Calditrichota bacterium]
MIWFFLLSGLFLGWSLGANNAANIFGTAVGTKMVRFRTAALVASIFVILGAVLDGAGATHTLGELGAVNAMAGSFTVALAAGVTVAWMTKLKLPASVSQAIVGAIIGWNFFTGSPTDLELLTKIISTWIVGPVLAAVFAIILFKLAKFFLDRAKIHLLELDAYTRLGLIVVGAFGAYSLGANNIANVMGVFVPASPFHEVRLFGFLHLSGTQQLFFLGALAIAVGICTYSYRVMRTVGNEIFRLSPVTALVVVLSESLVLLIFASEGLKKWLVAYGLPPIPLVPVSSAQALVGAIIGISIVKSGGKGINFSLLWKIASGWVSTPVAAGLLSFASLFFVQNVFQQEVVKPVTYGMSRSILVGINNQSVPIQNQGNPNGQVSRRTTRFQNRLNSVEELSEEPFFQILGSGSKNAGFWGKTGFTETYRGESVRWWIRSKMHPGATVAHDF